MIKANIKKDYPLMSKPFLIFTSFEEERYISSIVNASNCSVAALDLRNISIDKVKDFKELAIKICTDNVKTGLKLNNIYLFLKENFNIEIGHDLYIAPEGIFSSREEYYKWQQLYGLLKRIEKE